MINKIEEIKKLNIVMVDKDELEELCKDRLDFGFDSVYFRYATIVDELITYKMFDRNSNNYGDKQYWNRWGNNQKMRFYKTLEQLVHAHEEGDS